MPGDDHPADPQVPTDPADPSNAGTPQVRVRPDVWSLAAWDDTLLWYARAIAEMQRRPIDDPTSWRFQAAIHAYVRSRDPYADPTDRLPGLGDRTRFWNQCQHGSWYFLPWHRMYLGYFEQIIATTVEDLGGPAGWSLPYWNYSDDTHPDARRIPPAFRDPTLPDGSPNPLRVTQRASGANSGGIVASPQDVDVTVCLREPVFTGSAQGGTSGFGGPQTNFQHGGGTVGKLEATPHGDIHVAVGGWFPTRGFMSLFETAGLDPLFWLHHANIDRLWNVWLRRSASHSNPTKTQWLDGPVFELHDAAGSLVTHTCRDVEDSETSPFRYRYQDESDPLAPPVPAGGPVIAAAAAAGGPTMDSQQQPPAEMVGATDEATQLRGTAVTRRVELSPPTGPVAATLEAGPEAPSPRLHVAIENIKGSVPIPHLVYVNLPEGADPADHPERLVGSLSMFGIAEASGEDPEHPGSGLQYSLDVTDVVERLGLEGEALDELRVTLVPKVATGQELVPAAASLEAAPPSIEVGRISVYRGE